MFVFSVYLVCSSLPLVSNSRGGGGGGGGASDTVTSALLLIVEAVKSDALFSTRYKLQADKNITRLMIGSARNIVIYP